MAQHRRKKSFIQLVRPHESRVPVIRDTEHAWEVGMGLRMRGMTYSGISICMDQLYGVSMHEDWWRYWLRQLGAPPVEGRRESFVAAGGTAGLLRARVMKARAERAAGAVATEAERLAR